MQAEIVKSGIENLESQKSERRRIEISDYRF